MTDRALLFRASCVALIVTAMSFALRGGAIGAWTAEFGLTNEQAGWINSTAFWGFTLAMVFGGPLCDAIGMGRILRIAFVGHAAGILLTIFAWDYWSLFAGTLLFGIANGSVEAACNPLIATLYPDDKTTRLNQFHVWFPGGIVIGGLVGFALAKGGLGWKVQFATMLLPLAAYGLMFRGRSLPRTERVEMGVSTRGMFAACMQPLFLLMVACMLLTAATELGPGQWIPSILENAGVSGILVLVWITGLMAVGRQFAGPFVHHLRPTGMLLGSAVLSAAGLFLMSRTQGAMLFGAATVFALGVCFFWPTMLGFVNERLPRTGALGLAIMGGAGMLSVSIVLPVIGRIYDQGIAARLAEGTTVESLRTAAAGTPQAAEWAAVQSAAGLEALGKVAVLPLALTAVFAALAVAGRRNARPAATQAGA
ncbi:MAG: MFS transporter [Proteobacteria bacterium]|nr:MFS transporter [Pseudomonadota bacterium]